MAVDRRARRAAEPRLRRRWGTVLDVLLATLTALLLLALVVSLVLAALAPDNPLDTFGWVVQAWLVLPLAVVVGAWWWRLLSGRRDGQDDPDVADDEPAAQRHHRSLSGEDAPPTRW